MPRTAAISRIALASLLALAAASCGGGSNFFADQNDGGWFSKRVEIFKTDNASASSPRAGGDLTPKGPVGPDDLIGADGRCFVPIAETAQASVPVAPLAPADRPVGSMAGDLAGAPMPAGQASAPPVPAVDPAAPRVMGGIALGMTECQTVARAGQPGNVGISAGERGERAVMLTYLSGPWPGIYHFSDGRLKEIDRAPAPPEAPKKPAKKVAKKKAPAKKTTVQ
ncbi:MAG: hypothetical protein ABI830_07600 [Pseudolabrys sp.]